MDSNCYVLSGTGKKGVGEASSYDQNNGSDKLVIGKWSLRSDY